MIHVFISGLASTLTYCVCTQAVQHSALGDGFEGRPPQDAVHSLPQEVAVAQLWRHIVDHLPQLPVVGVRHAWEANAEPEGGTAEFWQAVGIYTIALFNTKTPRSFWGEQRSNNHTSVALRKVLVWIGNTSLWRAMKTQVMLECHFWLQVTGNKMCFCWLRELFSPGRKTNREVYYLQEAESDTELGLCVGYLLHRGKRLSSGVYTLQDGFTSVLKKAKIKIRGKLRRLLVFAQR